MTAPDDDPEVASQIVAGPASDEPVNMTALGTVTSWLGRIEPATPDDDAVAAVEELLPEGSNTWPYLRRFAALTALSASIAAFGLLADSGAVVIGAMLVAPLMTPIIGASAAIVTANNRRLLRAMLIIALGTVIALAVGWLVSLIAGGRVIDVRTLPDEIQNRTFPGLLDLGIAITAGAAAGYIQPRRSAIAALPGVGIAVALVPPLATAGVTYQLGLGDDARNAFLLYLTNLAAIIFSAALVLLASGFRPHSQAGLRAVRVRLATTLIAVAIVAIPLSLHTRSVIRDLRLNSAVVSAVEAWDPDIEILDQDADVTGGRAEVDLLVVGRGDPLPIFQLAEGIAERFGGPVDLRVRYQSNELFVVSTR